ncbi:ABC transporter permease [Chelativorans sp. AA-79]|uniref:ABC transporter permease n=1 Tax=Chelativorans sp. AA-79 TaxID=3028735 RepID=UPI0023F86B4A|nr:ABC transporter permease [Chelativorans sp. AA-79]WEX11291.1 ABC transporter permease [Chelativorans sp. AA-79]
MQYETVGALGIFLGVVARFWPVWGALALVFAVSLSFRKRLGLYGHLYASPAGIAGLAICFFWLFTAIFADAVAPFDPLQQIAVMKDAPPGAIVPETGGVFLLGGDRLARDVFSRVVFGSQIVLLIAPAATLFALVVGTMLGLPAGYHGGRIDKVLSFLANLVLAFPVILLFYLLVTPGVRETPLPQWLAGIFFIFPMIFFGTLVYTGFSSRPGLLAVLLVAVVLLGGWVYAGLVFDADPLGVISIAPNELNIFVAVVFASSPGVFRIVRGLTMDIKTREYVAAAQTRGEGPWYIMLWEILPNARGPLIVDACLRVGYTTILLGTLGYFGLGLAPESPDWGTAIKESSRLLRAHIHPALPPVVALMSFVLGLNLLADALREQALKD